jgi:hypothetical protein
MNVAEHEKSQPAPAFPPGWLFFFETGDPEPGIHSELLGLRLVSDEGVKYKSVDAAINRHTNQLQRVKKHVFYKHIGVSLLDTVIVHPLAGQGFCREWINIHGQRQEIYGTITKVETDNVEDQLKFTVVYDEESLEHVNVSDSGCGGLLVPTCDIICERIAWGGCLSFRRESGSDKRNLLNEDAPFHTHWIAPRAYRRELSNQRSGRDGTHVDSVPRVVIRHRLHHHGLFKLEFTVKTSTIENAGLGVFLSCRPMMREPDDSTYFELPAGELLDFGIYAPFRTQDKKSDAEFQVLNFIHNFKCEEYKFDTADDDDGHCFDITDEITGDLHMEARKHVLPFVNEIRSGDEIPMVHAKYDCQGNVHYLLGYDEKAHGPFRIKADGQEHEIFIDYGARYEKARVRQRYSRNHVDENEALVCLKEDERKYIDDLGTYSAKEVQNSIKLLEEIASEESGLQQSVIERIAVVTILLKLRAEKLLREFAGVTEEDSICDNGARDLDKELVESCRKLLRRVCHLWGDDRDLKKRMLEVDIFAGVCKHVFPGRDLKSMSPSAFRNLICGS